MENALVGRKPPPVAGDANNIFYTHTFFSRTSFAATCIDKAPGSIIPICNRFETTGSTRLAGGWLLIFMMYTSSTLLPRGERALLGCSEHGCRLLGWLKARMISCNCEPRDREFETRLPRLVLLFFNFQSSFDSIRYLFSKTGSITIVFHSLNTNNLNNFINVYMCYLMMNIYEHARASQSL